MRDRLLSLADPDYVVKKSRQAEHYKLKAELHFWTDIWNKRLLDGELWDMHNEGADAVSVLKRAGAWEEWEARKPWSYQDLRWMEARAQVFRVHEELALPSEFLLGKRVMDIGPGLVGFLEASEASIGIAVEPLAIPFKDRGLLLSSDKVVYLGCGAESLPLPDASVDVVLSRNNLDHVHDPEKVVKEVRRVLSKGGRFLLVVHLEEEASPTEPHAFGVDDVHALVDGFETVHEQINEVRGRSSHGKTLAGVYKTSE